MVSPAQVFMRVSLMAANKQEALVLPCFPTNAPPGPSLYVEGRYYTLTRMNSMSGLELSYRIDVQGLLDPISRERPAGESSVTKEPTTGFKRRGVRTTRRSARESTKRD